MENYNELKIQYYFQFTMLSNFFSDENTAGDITFADLIILQRYETKSHHDQLNKKNQQIGKQDKATDTIPCDKIQISELQQNYTMQKKIGTGKPELQPSEKLN